MSASSFQALRDLESAAQANALPLPLGENGEPQWQGIGYQLGGIRLVSAMGEVREVLQPPRYTPLPGVQSWVLGIANIRGRLIPIIDLHRYLDLDASLPPSLARVLVVEGGGLVAGLLVEASLGIQHFMVSAFELPGADVPGAIAPLVRGAYRHGGRIYYEAKLSGLLEQPRFRDVAIHDEERTPADTLH
ncbi:MAG: purine-binding chemotaxis protein CheW [Pseudomonadales bacterium]|nr:purine-binding chemotaxis protein CheW [Pseudomonadales bacterium]MCP5183411.1 purine-binding chemotaxis protein CheW [Pseudomonadales bacterium]